MGRFTADFETCDKTERGDGVRVWAWAICSIDEPEKFWTGTSIETFLEWIGNAGGGTFYFHNLKYDGRYLVDYFLNHNWSYVDKKPRRTREFTTLISSMGAWYSISCLIWSRAEKRLVRVTFLDSMKLLPMKVADVAEAFELDEGKGELDYETFRPVGHQLTDEEEDYIRRDVQIMAKALHICIIDEGMDRMTIGSNALASWRKGFPAWKSMFPKLGNVCDRQIREAYRGGFTYCMPEFRDVDVYDGISLDFNSMYPSMMIGKKFPFGEPIYFEGQYTYDEWAPLFVQHVLVSWTLKESGIPFLNPSVHGIFHEAEYPAVVDEPVEMWLTNIDFELMDLMYDYDVWAWYDGWKFNVRDGKDFFGEYVSYWGSRKEQSTGPRRMIAKLYLNNLYGKFATREDNEMKVPYYHLRKHHVVYRTEPSRSTETVYIPIAVFCTAYARDTLLRAAMANRDRFIYCDTDSLHLLGTEPPEGIPIDDKKLGHWKIEGRFHHARHLRAKTYAWDLNGKFDVICAGMPENIKERVTWENFHLGFSNCDENGNIIPGMGKLLARTVDGGAELYEGKFELRGQIV